MLLQAKVFEYVLMQQWKYVKSTYNVGVGI
jgi:hypothetical protein